MLHNTVYTNYGSPEMMFPWFFRREDPQQEIGFIIWMKRRWDDHVLSGFQSQSQTHFARLAEHRHSTMRVIDEPLLVQHPVFVAVVAVVVIGTAVVIAVVVIIQ